MTPQKREELTQHLAEHGLSVVMTKDFDSILIQLARLAQFERLMEAKAESDKRLSETIKMVRLLQENSVLEQFENTEPPRPLEMLDIPTLVTYVHKMLHVQLGKAGMLNYNSVHAATTAFIGILFRK